MALQKFDLESLALLDGGRARVVFDQLMRRVHADCEDRPGLKGARKVAMTVELVPVAADDSSLDSVDVTISFTATIPKRRTKSYNMRAERGGLLFNELSPEEARQMTLDMAPRPTPVETTDRGAHTKQEEVANAG